MTRNDSTAGLVETGNAGVDDILQGGLTPNRIYLVEGDPGAGKTTLAMEFLLSGIKKGETGLYVTLSETKEELTDMARSHGWSVDKVHVFELIPSEEKLKPDSQYTVFHPSEVELSETTKAILDEVERIRPSRVVFDSLSEMRLLAQNPLRFRRQILALKQFFIGRKCTVLMLDDRTSDAGSALYSIAHGVLGLERLAPEYGAERRRFEVKKMRGRQYRGGLHDFVIRRGGLEVFPRLVAAEHRMDKGAAVRVSGLPALDALLGGGIDRGTSTLILGPAGTGKSTIALQYAVTAVEQGESAVVFCFDEGISTAVRRAEGVGIRIHKALETERLSMRQIDPAEMSPGEFGALVRKAAEGGARVLVIDSLNGYMNAMPGEHFLTIQLHELLSYLGQMGVNTFLLIAQAGIMGPNMQSPIDASYLADNVLLFRYFEAGGRIRKAISVLKKRSGRHEDTIRELAIASDGIKLSEPLDGFRGIMTGVPATEESGQRIQNLLK